MHIKRRHIVAALALPVANFSTAAGAATGNPIERIKAARVNFRRAFMAESVIGSEVSRYEPLSLDEGTDEYAHQDAIFRAKRIELGLDEATAVRRSAYQAMIEIEREVLGDMGPQWAEMIEAAGDDQFD